jgi:hypothetical protein
MKNINYYQYCKDNFNESGTIELLQHEINYRVYYFGKQFSSPWENKIKLKSYIRNKIMSFYKVLNTKEFNKDIPLIFSNASFNINDKLKGKKYEVVNPWWSLQKGNYLKVDLNYKKQYNEIFKQIKNNGLHDLTSLKFLNEIKNFKEKSKALILSKNFKAAFFSNDLGFFERLFIDVFKELGIPTFIFLHGLPARYNDIDDNRTDYLIVWGKKIKENFFLNGVSKDKIIISGHPNFKSKKLLDLKFDLSNIVVLSKAMNGSSSISNNNILSDRGNCLLYLKAIKSVLRSFGIEQVKLRLHPSENELWYSENIDTVFFVFCNSNSLKSVLNSSTLLIGPTSTVALEALYYDTNYLIFEPQNNGLDILNYPTVDPFNSNNSEILVAKNEDDLKMLIQKKYCVSTDFLNNYVEGSFDLTEVFNKIN